MVVQTRGGRRAQRWVGLLVLLAGLLAAACSGPAASPTSVLQPGRTWNLVEVRTAGATLSPIPSGRASTVRFQDGHLTGWDSVNTRHATYTETGTQLTISKPDSTAVGVVKESPEQGQVLSATGKLFSPSGPVTARATADHLELTAGPYVLVFA